MSGLEDLRQAVELLQNKLDTSENTTGKDENKIVELVQTANDLSPLMDVSITVLERIAQKANISKTPFAKMLDVLWVIYQSDPTYVQAYLDMTAMSDDEVLALANSPFAHVYPFSLFIKLKEEIIKLNNQIKRYDAIMDEIAAVKAEVTATKTEAIKATQKAESALALLHESEEKRKMDAEKLLQISQRLDKSIPDLSKPIEVPFNPDSDRGLFDKCSQILAKQFSTSEFVSVTASSVWVGHPNTVGNPQRIIEFGDKHFATENAENSYIMVHLKRLTATVTGYLIQGSSKDPYHGNNIHIKKWEFQGSNHGNPGGKWETLHVSNPETDQFTRPFYGKCFQLSKPSNYEYFRIKMTGPCGLGDHHLRISYIDIFGTLEFK